MKRTESDLPWLRRALDGTGAAMRGMLAAAGAHGQLRGVLGSALAARGKMLRPALLLLCAGEAAAAGEHGPALLRAAAAVELAHTASLIHDDITDDAPTRRGRPSVQSAYGKSAAVYAGDYVLISALRELAAHGDSRVAEALAACVQRMCDGELIQLSSRYDAGTDEAAYFAAAEGKTAALFELACRLGAELGGARAAEAAALSLYGRKLGLMFQIRDDLLDWTAAEAETGKRVNSDFFTGVYTLPAIHTFADARYGRRLRELASGPADAAAAAEARELVRLSGGIDAARARLAGLGAEAAALAAKRRDAQCRALLEGLAAETAEN